MNGKRSPLIDWAVFGLAAALAGFLGLKAWERLSSGRPGPAPTPSVRTVEPEPPAAAGDSPLIPPPSLPPSPRTSERGAASLPAVRIDKYKKPRPKTAVPPPAR